MSNEVFLFYVLIWGWAVVADSGQFSSLCAKFAPKHLVGSALMITTCVGYTITIVSIQLIAGVYKAGLDIGLTPLSLLRSLSLPLPPPHLEAQSKGPRFITFLSRVWIQWKLKISPCSTSPSPRWRFEAFLQYSTLKPKPL